MSSGAADWAEGYISEIGYTYGYYPELNPTRIAVPFVNVGLAPPRIATACELGFGQGVSVNIHAAASDILWYGTDFNPGHAGLAQTLAAASGSGARLFDQSFAEFCARTDLPDFDYIALHGVLSWVSPENQRIIVDFLGRKLKPGGVLYLSYNCLPGQAATIPLRHLLTEHAAKMTAPAQGIVGRIDAALDFAERLLALNPGFAIANPAIADRLKAIKSNDRHYLAHEYFNRDWHAVPFAEMAASLASAKLAFACSANYLDHIDALNMNAEQHRFLGEIADPLFRQTVRDFVINQQFRRDYWVKGSRRLAAIEQNDALRALQVMLLIEPSDVAFTVQGAIGQREISPGVYRPILDALADHRRHTLAEVETTVEAAGIRLPTIYEAVMVLAARGDLTLVQDDGAQQVARPRAVALNRHILRQARGEAQIAALASPVTGGGVPVSRFAQLFLLAGDEGRKTADALAAFAWDIMAAQGQRMAKDGQPLETPEANLAELAHQAEEFLNKRLPVLQVLQVAS